MVMVMVRVKVMVMVMVRVGSWLRWRTHGTIQCGTACVGEGQVISFHWVCFTWRLRDKRPWRRYTLY